MSLLSVIQEICESVVEDKVKTDIFIATITHTSPFKFLVEDSTKVIVERQVTFLEMCKPSTYRLTIPIIRRVNFEDETLSPDEFVLLPCQGHPEGVGCGSTFADSTKSNIITFSKTEMELSVREPLVVGDKVALVRIGKKYLCYGRVSNAKEVVK